MSDHNSLFCRTKIDGKEYHKFEKHPYLFGAVSGLLCGPCASRVKFTRESLRVISLGRTLRPHESLVSLGWAPEHPPLDKTHANVHCGGSYRVLTTTTPVTAFAEEVCAVCAGSVAFEHPRRLAGDVIRCPGERDGAPCPLVYHMDCLRRVGCELPALPRDWRCPFCLGCEQLPCEERRRFREGYRVHEKMCRRREGHTSRARRKQDVPPPQPVPLCHTAASGRLGGGKRPSGSNLKGARVKGVGNQKRRRVSWADKLETIRFDQTEFGLAMDATEREVRAHAASQHRTKLRRLAEEADRVKRLATGGRTRPADGGGHLCLNLECQSTAKALAEEVRSMWVACG